MPLASSFTTWTDTKSWMASTPGDPGTATNARKGAMSSFAGWDNFYVIVGSAAGALTGLTFVVISLVAGRRQEDATWGVDAFTTPTIVHFGIVLLVSASLTAPWPSLGPAAILLGLCGLAGVAYAGIVIRRMRHVTNYQLVGEDWLWYVACPLVVYVALLITAILLPRNPTPALFAIAAELLAILFLGIHNAWDVVIYIAVVRANEPTEGSPGTKPEEK